MWKIRLLYINLTLKTMKDKDLNQHNQENVSIYKWLGLISIIWLITYIVCRFVWQQKLGWDEVSYLTCAKGIANDFDFSSRTTTVQGLLKYGFPQHTHHYPVLSTYIAIFLKLFGNSLQVAYFSTWFAGLVTCIFIYFTMLLLSDNNIKFSFFIAIVFLFLPRIANYCDSGMMEIPGCALLSILIFFIFKDLKKNKLNPVLLSVSFILLFFYKSLFIGIFFGLLTLILFCNNFKLPVYLQALLYVAVILVLYFTLSKYLFLPLAPMMNFHLRQEGAEGCYADFMGGFFNNATENIKINLLDFYNNILCRYFPINHFFNPAKEKLYVLSPDWYELGFFYLFLFYAIFALVISWKKFNPLQRMFILFSNVSIVSFNVIFCLISTASVNILCRYNLLYVPLLLISSALGLFVSFKSLFLKQTKSIYILFVLLISFLYFPYYFLSNRMKIRNDSVYNSVAHNNSEIVRKFIGGSNPSFIYFHTGQHTTWDLYPIRVILMDATNNQIKKINSLIPKPIEYLFLQPANELFKENQDLIIKGQPIIDNWYTFYGFDQINNVVVYKLNSQVGVKNNE